MANLRLSSHKLNIETGRYIQGQGRLPPDQRLCNKCNLKKCEDEFHFIIECPYYNATRDTMLTAMTERFNYISNYDKTEIYNWLISNQDDFVNINLAKFVKEAFLKRSQ